MLNPWVVVVGRERRTWAFSYSPLIPCQSMLEELIEVYWAHVSLERMWTVGGTTQDVRVAPNVFLVRIQSRRTRKEARMVVFGLRYRRINKIKNDVGNFARFPRKKQAKKFQTAQ